MKAPQQVLNTLLFQVQCTTDGKTPGFKMACNEGQEPVPGYKDGDRLPGAPQPYVWQDRTDKSDHALYTVPLKSHVALKCHDIVTRTFCDPRARTECPCNCDCVDAEAYNARFKTNVTLGESYFCEPVSAEGRG